MQSPAESMSEVIAYELRHRSEYYLFRFHPDSGGSIIDSPETSPETCIYWTRQSACYCMLTVSAGENMTQAHCLYHLSTTRYMAINFYTVKDIPLVNT